MEVNSLKKVLKIVTGLLRVKPLDFKKEVKVIMAYPISPTFKKLNSSTSNESFQVPKEFFQKFKIFPIYLKRYDKKSTNIERTPDGKLTFSIIKQEYRNGEYHGIRRILENDTMVYQGLLQKVKIGTREIPCYLEIIFVEDPKKHIPTIYERIVYIDENSNFVEVLHLYKKDEGIEIFKQKEQLLIDNSIIANNNTISHVVIRRPVSNTFLEGIDEETRETSITNDEEKAMLSKKIPNWKWSISKAWKLISNRNALVYWFSFLGITILSVVFTSLVALLFPSLGLLLSWVGLIPAAVTFFSCLIVATVVKWNMNKNEKKALEMKEEEEKIKSKNQQNKWITVFNIKILENYLDRQTTEPLKNLITRFKRKIKTGSQNLKRCDAGTTMSAEDIAAFEYKAAKAEVQRKLIEIASTIIPKKINEKNKSIKNDSCVHYRPRI